MNETAHLDHISPLLPIDFFSCHLELHEVEKKVQKKHLLPHFDALLDEDPFARVSMGWNRSGLLFQIEMLTPFKDCFFPEYRKGESVELFIDTRDNKSARSISRFCHHFVFLPQAVEGVQAQEMTPFRGEEKHELCAAEKLHVDVQFQSKGYTYHIFLAADCLYGYDPSAFQRLGVAYRINQGGKRSQHLAPSSRYLALEHQPSLWSTMEMIES